MTQEDMWKHLMLLPTDYVENAIFCDDTIKIMDKIRVEEGGPEYDALYPEGIPCSVEITTSDNKVLDSGIVSIPAGHSANDTVNLADVLQHKFKKLGVMAFKEKDLVDFVVKLENIGSATNEDLEHIYECKIAFSETPIDASASETEEIEEKSA